MRWSFRMMSVAVGVAAACGQVPGKGEPEPEPDAGIDTRPVHAGAATPLMAVHVNGLAHRSPRLAAGGARLYFLVDVGGHNQVYAAARSATGWSAPQPVAGSGWAEVEMASLSIADDELEIVVGGYRKDGDQDLFAATRASVDQPFGRFERVSVSSPGSVDEQPAIANDELLFVSNRVDGERRVYRATRARRGGAFGEASTVTLEGVDFEASAPWLAADRHTLYYTRTDGDTTAVFHARRADVSTGAFTGAVELTELRVAGQQTSAAIVTEDEVIFESNRPWSPSALSLWSAPICRGEPCRALPSVDCAGGVSPDGRRCYVLVTDVIGWAVARAQCEMRNAHLVTIHSRAELDLVLELGKGQLRMWTGANDLDTECNQGLAGCVFAWSNGDPFTYAPWFDLVNPDDSNGGEDCVELVTAAYVRPDGVPTTPGFNDVGCGIGHAFVCER